MSTHERRQQGANEPREQPRKKAEPQSQSLDDAQLDKRLKQPGDEDEHIFDEEEPPPPEQQD